MAGSARRLACPGRFDPAALPTPGFFRCVADLEDELIQCSLAPPASTG